MRAAVLDIVIHRGDNYALTINFVNRTTGEAINYSDADSFAAQIRPDYDSTRVWDFTVDDTDIATGVLVLTLANTDTAKMPRECVWDLEMDTGGVITTLIKGSATVDRDVTR